MAQLKIFGIKNCSTMKKAFDWLDTQGIAYAFHDYKKDIPQESDCAHWLKSAGMDTVLNKRGTTWRNIPEKEKQLESDADAITLMQNHPSAIKRPIVTVGKKVLVGFDPDQWQSQLIK